MSNYGYLEVFQRVPFDFEITRVDCIFFDIRGIVLEFTLIYQYTDTTGVLNVKKNMNCVKL